MSADPVGRANLAAIACDSRPQLPDGFRRSSTRVGTLLGAARTGLSVYELPPGQAVSPYHYEDPEEEWLLVVSGTPTLRHPGGEDQLEPWDVVFFPAGPAGAHLVRNNSESTARVAMLSSIAAVGAVVYPDSDIIQISTTDATDDIVVKRNSGVDVAPPSGLLVASQAETAVAALARPQRPSMKITSPVRQKRQLPGSGSSSSQPSTSRYQAPDRSRS